MGLIRTAIEGDEIIVTAEGSTEKITLPLDPRFVTAFPFYCSLHFLCVFQLPLGILS